MSDETMNGAGVVAPAGRFDAHAAPAVADALAEAAERSGGRVVVDLGGVDFIDTTGLSTLVTAMKRCRERGGDLRLAAPSQPVRIILELTRLDAALGMHDDVAAAAASFGEGDDGPADAR